ncbi:hypothetical protein ALC60_01103 [Trachymyrmex zeteki]|uniref:Gustatory receptor n=1 Tax=Mycetomoellerius zeteki TaxID=64791 RepID=A0A151XHJ1_9HYME|nr:hypothetical protein ALC60_01103 [Trachymyrmex zeteki]
MRKKWFFHATDFESLMYLCFILCRIFGIFLYKLQPSGFIMIVTHVLSGPRMRLLQTISKISLKLPSKSYKKMFKFIHVKDTCIKGLFQENQENDNLACIQGLMVNDVNVFVPKFICHVQKNQSLLIKLKILKKQHLMISDAVQMLNIIFSLQLVATIFMTFSAITFRFSLQVLHRENIFSTKFFTIDTTLLITVMGNVTTYLLILIQFLNISHSCDGKIAINVTQFKKYIIQFFHIKFEIASYRRNIVNCFILANSLQQIHFCFNYFNYVINKRRFFFNKVAI